MHRTFPEEMVHIQKLIEDIPRCHPELTWFHKDAELVTAKRREHATEMAALEEAEEVEETIIG